MAFSKLDSGIINSSIWSEPLATRVLWITILAMKDENGFVGAASSGLRRSANISEDEFNIAIKALESPDSESRTLDYDGRRIAKIDGGWVVLNHEKYRSPETDKKSTRNEYMKNYMRKIRDVNINRKLTPINDGLTSVSVSVSNSVSDINSGKGSGGNQYFEAFKKAYPINGSELNPEVENWFIIRTDENFLNFEKVISAAEAYAMFWKETESDTYPHSKMMKQAINWLREAQYEIDWTAKLAAEKKYVSAHTTNKSPAWVNKAEPGKYDKIDSEGKI